MNRIPIVFSTDHNFVMPTCVTIHSLLKTKKEGVEYDINIIINDDVNDKDKEIIEKQVSLDSPDSRVNFISIGQVFKDSFEIRDISIATYSRLLIPWLLPQYNKILYSDVDIIFKGDISEIYEIEMGNNLVAGYTSEVWGKGFIKKYINRIGLNPKSYVNAGFIVINSRLQREENLNATYLDYAKRKFLYQDQDILNIVCKGRTQQIPKNYNIKPVDVYNFPPEEVKVIHYTGLKPWDHFTFSWCDWWEVYNTSVVFDPNRNKMVSKKILNWKTEIIKKKKVISQKIKFLKEYISFK